MRVRFLLLPLLFGLGLCGCAAIQDYQYNLVQRCRADSAYKGTYGMWSRCSSDYQHGWKQGYFDLSTGQCDEAPATPPHKYWDAKYQSLEGQAAIQEWYSGWQDGATAAIEDGRPYFHPVVASPTAPVNPYNPRAFHCGPSEHQGLEAMPPVMPMAMPTHEPQPQVHVGPAPQRFASQTIAEGELLDDELLDDEHLDDEDLLDESALPAGEPSNDPYFYGEQASGNDYE